MNKPKLLFSLLAAMAVVSAAAEEYRVTLPEVAATLRKARAGDRIVVADGDYRESMWNVLNVVITASSSKKESKHSDASSAFIILFVVFICNEIIQSIPFCKTTQETT